ncbi:Nose resistant to fluoxetine protein 6 like protein [Argiope bruennichi]|uniref:Nose resistant to fluoxetine protein 6 like protein n=1 Tax=Argiope bruennichi TaxID=94029 RepID=A0A8T0FX32_ARGBR|nr:Nose resistant to fluoxetine protein 6 like protein [Argiope bruennichi]
MVTADDNQLKVFEKLSELNEKWLLANFVPETAALLRYPPYSYYTNGLSTNVTISDLLTKSEYGSATTSDENNKRCSDDLVQILYHLDSAWALQMLDSDGKPDSGIMRGGLIWPGHFDECNSVFAPEDDEGHGGFHGKYCVTTWTLNLGGKYSKLPLQVGICVPDSCSEAGLKHAGKNVIRLLERLPMLKNHTSVLTLKDVTCKLKEKHFDIGSTIYVVFVSCFVLLVLLGSAVTIKNNWRRRQFRSISYSEQKNVQDSEVSEAAAINCTPKTYEVYGALLVQNPEVGVTSSGTQKNTDQSIAKRILLCFSAVENGEKILSTNISEGQLLSVHGIRFLSLTGFLLAYLFLKEADRKNGKISWLYFYVHRFWRLTPAYMVVVFFYIFVFKYMGSGPFWEDDHCDAYHGSWWKYLLYINNFIPIHQMCIGWSWYLANDMQFYFISPLFLYPLWRWPRIGFGILAPILLGTWITTGVLSYKYDLIPMFVGAVNAKDLDAYGKRMWDSFDLIYDKPYCRIAPYIIGVILGFMLYKLSDKKNFMNWWQQALGWALAAFCSLSVVFGLYHVEMSRTTSLFYNALCRSSFTIGLAWVIFVCETGHGGFITKFLSWKLFIPLSRLTYCAYLVHPILIHAYYQAYPTALYFTELLMVTNFMGFLIMSYGIAFLFSLTFESPLMNLEKLIVKRKSG